MKTALLAALMLTATPAVAKQACVIVYANDMGAAVTREIRQHELAHCNGWTHPAGMDKKRGYGRAYLPPKKFLRAYPGKVYETPVRTSEARDRCNGQLGCSVLVDD
jgi:hypothetical protein